MRKVLFGRDLTNLGRSGKLPAGAKIAIDEPPPHPNVSELSCREV